MVKMAWDRLLVWFMPVLPVLRWPLPCAISSSISLWLATRHLDRSAHRGAHVPFPSVGPHPYSSLTLNVGAVQRVLPHSQSSVPVGRLLFKEIAHAFIVDLQIAGDTETNKKSCL